MIVVTLGVMLALSLVIGFCVHVVLKQFAPEGVAGDMAAEERLKRYTTAYIGVAAKEDFLGRPQRSLLHMLKGPARALGHFPVIGPVTKALTTARMKDKYEKMLVKADISSEISLEDLMAVKVFTAVVLPVAGMALILSTGLFGLFLWLGMMYAGFVIPDSSLKSLVEARQYKIKRILPDALDLLIIGVEAGMGLDRAIRLYCERFKNVLSFEFKKTMEEIDIGHPRREALKTMAERVDAEDLTMFISAILQAERLGTPLSTVLRAQSDDLKIRYQQWVQELSAKAPIKMLFPLAGLIMPALFIVLMGPIVLKMIGGGS